MPTRIKTFLALSDSHGPFEHRPSILKICEVIKERKPDYVIHLGDLVEGASASRHPNEFRHDHIDECEHAEWVLANLMDANPMATWVITRGNHDENLIEENRLAPSLRRAVDLDRHVPSLQRWRQIPYVNNRKHCFRLGQVTFVHGFSSGENSDRDEARKFGTMYGLTVRGHTHRPLPVTQMKFGTKHYFPYWYANTGTTGPLEPTYMKRKDSDRWGRAFLVGEARVGRRHYGERCEWQAELITL